VIRVSPRKGRRRGEYLTWIKDTDILTECLIEHQSQCNTYVGCCDAEEEALKLHHFEIPQHEASEAHHDRYSTQNDIPASHLQSPVDFIEGGMIVRRKNEERKGKIEERNLITND